MNEAAPHWPDTSALPPKFDTFKEGYANPYLPYMEPSIRDKVNILRAAVMSLRGRHITIEDITERYNELYRLTVGMSSVPSSPTHTESQRRVLLESSIALIMTGYEISATKLRDAFPDVFTGDHAESCVSTEGSSAPSF